LDTDDFNCRVCALFFTGLQPIAKLSDQLVLKSLKLDRKLFLGYVRKVYFYWRRVHCILVNEIDQAHRLNLKHVIVLYAFGEHAPILFTFLSREMVILGKY
jgi:hypothetical protein